MLHLVDHATKYIALVVIKSKKKIIVEKSVKILIEILAHLERFLANGEEFDNDEFRDF